MIPSQHFWNGFQATLKYDPNEAGFDRMKNYDRFIIKKMLYRCGFFTHQK